MPDIKMNSGETALWNEVGSRGDLFRAAMRDRAHEQTRVTKDMTQICDPAGGMLDAVQRADPVPETVHDEETQREVASLPALHKGEEPSHAPASDETFAAGTLDHRDRLANYGGGDSGRVIAGELHAQPPRHPVKDVAHEVAEVAKVVGHVVHEVAQRVTHRGAHKES